MKYLYTFTIPIILTIFLIPILSIEGVTPWVIFVFFTYKIIKVSNNKALNKKFILKKVFIYFFLSLVFAVLYNLIAVLVTHLVVNNL